MFVLILINPDAANSINLRAIFLSSTTDHLNITRIGIASFKLGIHKEVMELTSDRIFTEGAVFKD